MYPWPEFFARALEHAESLVPPAAAPLTGLTVPHHLLAVDLAAQGFARVRDQEVARVVILCPDHYRRGATQISVCARDLATCFGTLRADEELAQALGQLPGVSESTLFSHEHGVQALLPFIARLFPQARITALALKTTVDQAALDALAEALMAGLAPRGVVSEPTLVVQSTDFSHYLSPGEAAARDQQSLGVLAAGSAAGVLALAQPGQMDSRGAQYVQMRVQRELFQASCVVTANRNSQEYAREPLPETTSYMLQEWGPGDPEGWSGGEVGVHLFGGDFFCGRHLAGRVADPERRELLARDILAVTRGAPLILNLEGVLAQACPEGAGDWTLCMEAGPTLSLLKELRVEAVSLANNHARDLGEAGIEATRAFLGQAGIRVLEQGRVEDMGDFSLAVFTDLDNNPSPARNLLGGEDFQVLDGADPDKPLVALVHWGEEYLPALGPRQQFLEERLRRQGADLVIGGHSHCAGDLACDPGGCTMASLGNFLFDQSGPRVSGRLLEIRVFPQGTYALRTSDIPNFHAGP